MRHWATWPWNQCGAKATLPEGLTRCDLRKNHADEHEADYGMYNVRWSNPSFVARD